MAEPTASETNAGNDSDQDFDPSVEMMVDDFDDERTLEEEEAIAEEDSKEEIDELTKEGNMPIEELLARYAGYNDNNSVEEEIEEKTTDSNTSNSNQSSSLQSTSQQPSNSNNAASSSSSSAAARSSLANYMSDSESGSSSDGDDSTNEDEWRRTIQVGSDYQAVVPEGLNKYDDEKDEEKTIETRGDQNRDILVWKPEEALKKDTLDEFVKLYEGVFDDDNAIPLGEHSKDDDHALYLLFKCNYNLKEAIKQLERNPNPPADSTPIRKMMAPWTEEECRNFENGIRMHGKDFFAIKHAKIPTRTVGEVVTFYYFWKKTERHDSFINQQKLEKKKYSFHPGTTDYMDRFLDEQENMAMYQLNNNSTNSSHNSTSSLLHSANHHHHLNPSSSRQSSSSSLGLNSAQSRNHTNHHHYSNHQQNDPYFAGNNSGSSASVTISGNNMRTINVNASGETQTITINDADFNGPNQNNKPIVVCTGGSGSSKSSNFYRHNTPSHNHHHSSSSHRHSSHTQNLSTLDSTTTIVVGKNPVVIDGASMVSSSGGGSGATSNSPTSLSTPSVSIFKVSNSSGYNR